MIQKAKNYSGKDCIVPFFETQWRRKRNTFPSFNYQNIIQGRTSECNIITQIKYLGGNCTLNTKRGDIVTNRTRWQI
jgi:hypothetical protein